MFRIKAAKAATGALRGIVEAELRIYEFTVGISKSD